MNAHKCMHSPQHTHLSIFSRQTPKAHSLHQREHTHTHTHIYTHTARACFDVRVTWVKMWMLSARMRMNWIAWAMALAKDIMKRCSVRSRCWCCRCCVATIALSFVVDNGLWKVPANVRSHFCTYHLLYCIMCHRMTQRIHTDNCYSKQFASGHAGAKMHFSNIFVWVWVCVCVNVWAYPPKDICTITFVKVILVGFASVVDSKVK